jgi:hypothetical protein
MTSSRAPHRCVLEWLATMEQKKTTIKSWTPCCHGLGDLQHLNKKITQQWGVEFLIVVSLGPTTLKHNKELSSCHHVLDWRTTLEQKNVRWWKVGLLIVMALGLLTLEQKSPCLNPKKNIEGRKVAYLVVLLFFMLFGALISSHLGAPSSSPCFSSLS